MNTHALLREGSPYIVSGLLMLSGVLLAFARSFPRKVGAAFSRRFLASVTVSSGNALYYWARIWLDRHPYSRSAKNFTAKALSSSDPTNSAEDARFLLTPAFGDHLLRHRGRFVLFSRSREEKTETERGAVLEHMTFRMLGGSRSDIERLLLDMADAARELETRRTRIFVNGSNSWNEVATREPRPLDSMILVDGVLERICADLHAFRESRAWYRDMGIPHRRGVLLYGPPGTGKSSLVGALAGNFHVPLYLLSLSNPKLGDSDLIELLHEVESDAFVLLEDLDAAFDGRSHDESTGVTLSGLLNAIDGAAAKYGMILFVSTNHVDRLDPALKRPGRLDLHIALGFADEAQRRRLYERFFPGTTQGASFSQRTSARPVTVAQLQEFLLRHRYDEPGALCGAEDWLRETHATPAESPVQAPASKEAGFFVSVPMGESGRLLPT